MVDSVLWHEHSAKGASKYVKPAMAAAILLGAVVCANAWAGGGHHGHHGHSRASIGIAFGAPLWYGPGWYGDPWYGDPWYGDPWYGQRYYQPVQRVIVEPPVYIERGVPSATGPWYFCSNPEGYYPYVKQCSTAWRLVVPQSVLR